MQMKPISKITNEKKDKALEKIIQRNHDKNREKINYLSDTYNMGLSEIEWASFELIIQLTNGGAQVCHVISHIFLIIKKATVKEFALLFLNKRKKGEKT